MAQEKHTPEEIMAAIIESREVGALEGMLEEEPRYALMLTRVYPNGTSGEWVTDPAIAAAIGRKTGLGPPTDSLGWGIWEVGTATE